VTFGSIRLMCSGVILIFAVVALEAGGWVVITVTDVPALVPVGKPVQLAYAVRQHGRHLVGGLTGSIEARKGAKIVRLVTSPASERGHYAAALTLSDAGDWTIEIVSGFGGQFDASRMTLRAVDGVGPASAFSEAERGRQLFAAKGCITCHVDARVDGRSISVGPTLTAKRYQPDYLKRFLADPSNARADESKMPDLHLHATEIGPLVAFINAETRLATTTR
jgi:cytochrome c551/c552